MADLSTTGSDTVQVSRAGAWLSRDLSDLFDRGETRDGPPPPPHFDVLIIGSGYGGAIAAASLAGSRLNGNGRPGRLLRIAVLERGQEYLPGAFPSRLSEIPGHVRFSPPGATSPRGVRTGLFDVRLNADIVSVVANGLGGGSLINAGVMLPPHKAVFAEARWPSKIRSDPAGLDPFFERAARLLGAGEPEAPNTVARAGVAPTKSKVMHAIGGQETRDVPITVALGNGARSSAGVLLNACIGCGDCATGCNHGAKDSLDVNLLVHAWRHRISIYTGATVLRLEKIGSSWSVVVNHTDEALRSRQGAPFRIEADKVILAAGTFGSTEILMRSRGAALPLSTRLGQQFSGNGDLFFAAYDLTRDVNAVADESVRPKARNIGPTITAAIDDREGKPECDLSIQDLAVPGPLRPLFEEIFTTARTLHSLGQADRTRHAAGDADRNAVDHAAFGRTLPLALIGRDRADGELVPARGGALADDEGDGAVHVRWPEAAQDPRFDCHQRRAERLLARSGAGGRLLPNPAWKVLPDEVARTLRVGRGPLLSVHPLGGCPMGDDFRSGVVNDLGQVFTVNSKKPSEAHEGLVVLDGSIVPTSLGINPALTIATLALRAIETLRAAWGFSPGPTPGAMANTEALARPIFRTPPCPDRPLPTEVQIIERLRGKARLADGREHCLELTLHSHPVALDTLMSRTGPHRIKYEPDPSTLRVFAKAPSAIDDDPRGSPGSYGTDASRKHPGFEASAQVASGSLELLRLAPTWVVGRARRALWAWWWHRGARDIVQTWAGDVAGLTLPAPVRLWKRFKDSLAIATRAGAKRTLDYTLQLRNFKVAAGISLAELFGEAAAREGATLEARAHKTLTYDGRSSPWTQLMELTLDEFPGLAAPATLSLDLPYLARQGVALLRVVGQQDHVQALVDLASFHLYVLRTVLDAHLWSFRLPDRVPDRVIHRRPGAVPHLPPPQVTELKVAEVEGKPVHLRLTRYCPADSCSSKPPVLLIHGYSASGTTFAHPTLRPGLAGRLVQAGRDVWILDLRSSAGMPWCAHQWTFEEIGCEDIPLALHHIWRIRGGRVDVVAHCMGSAMLCMALLGDIPRCCGDAYPDLREAMKNRIRRIVLSQVGPLLVMAPTNQVRAFLMRYVKQFVQQLVPTGEYRFRPDGEGSMVDMLVDRLLATLPYPRDEFRIENPRWPPWARRPWVQTRRRMDILYGQTFKLGNLSAATLAHLDDFFGEMNLDTVTQVIHFARTRTITDAQGRPVFATRDRLDRLRGYPILSIHGEENGLVDVSTADLLQAELDLTLEVKRFPGFGHQDCLIGQDTQAIFDAIVEFLEKADPPAPEPLRTAGTDLRARGA